MRILSLLAAAFFAVALNAQVINFPDGNFKARLLAADTTNNIARDLGNHPVKIDANSDGEIDASEAENLSGLNVNNSGIASLEGLAYFTHLSSFLCESNQIVSLDISPLHDLIILEASFNYSLIQLNIKNGKITCNVPLPPPTPPGIGGANFEACTYLHYLCADDEEISNAQLYIDSYYSAANLVLNSYCTFTPGGDFYTVQGNVKLDLDNNGCNISDADFPNLKFTYSNGENTATAIANTSGNYMIPVIAGINSITPQIENPEYFTISPSSLSITFPEDASPNVRNFCITPNGVHPDLEIILLPMSPSRPGFDSKIKLIYKNKGNVSQSGTVAFAFNDAAMDFVSALPATSSNLFNYLYWNFTNLKPMESREILLTLNVNSPAEIPPVNSGFILNFTASINAGEAEDTPSDNSVTLYQTVVNSFDPNNKICLEGETVSPETIGKEVHYLIRFENNGTANAENVVVKDMIDTEKFDIASLVTIAASHFFVTRITEGNKVEFIFENINLPFDDANNDGYVAFKIKTKPSLGLGDSFSNTASIYFDYNLPITTNTATTYVGALAKQDFEFDNYFSVYPNPADDVLHIDLTTVSSVSIYNTLGQLVLSVPNASKTIDVSGLESGNYFVKINSGLGVYNAKFIKK